MDVFATRVGATLARAIPDYTSLLSARRLSGGASQETYRLEIESGSGPRTLAMRRAAGGPDAISDPVRPGLATEAMLFRVARAAGVPEPEVHYVLTPEDGLGEGFIMEWLEGETLGSRILRAPELDLIRPRLAYQCGQVLARIHAIDPIATGISERLNTVPTTDFIMELWEAYKKFDTPAPMIDYTARWLLDHLPEESEPRLVHNDFRSGNLMVTPDGITAVLDWEVAHLGDPIRDLGWICTNSWRFGNRELPVGGFGRLEDLLDGYESESGTRIEAERVRFWEVFGSYWWSVGCLRMADGWRKGPDQTVERPGIARRSSECQVDCANLIIPGPVELVSASEPVSSLDMPRIDELIVSVRDFLRVDLRKELEGRNSFLSLVASNSLDIVLRELTLSPLHLEHERARLIEILERDDTIDALRRALSTGLRDHSIGLDTPGLSEHLRATVVNQLAIDQPKYSGLAAALSHTASQSEKDTG